MPVDDIVVASTEQEGTAATRGREVDGSILAAARIGDPDAFATILRHYDGRLRALAYRIVGRADLMDDVVQQASMKAFRALPDFVGRSSLSTCSCALSARPPSTRYAASATASLNLWTRRSWTPRAAWTRRTNSSLAALSEAGDGRRAGQVNVRPLAEQPVHRRRHEAGYRSG